RGRRRGPCVRGSGAAGRRARRCGGHSSVPDYAGLLAQLGVKSVHFPVGGDGPQGLVPAVQAAMEAVLREPYGSVAVILDEDVLNTIVEIQPGHVAVPPLAGTSNGQSPTTETEDAIVRAAELLMNKQRPVFVLNQEVGRSPGARKAAEMLASLTGAHVVACYAPGTSFDRGHPAWCGNLSFGEADGVEAQLTGYGPDVVVVIGGPFPNNVWPNGRPEVPEGVPAIVISPDETDRTRCNIRPEVFVCANVGVTLTRLGQHLEGRQTAARQSAADERLRRIAEANRSALEARIAAYETHMNEVPVHPARVAKELAMAIEARAKKKALALSDVAIFDEALTSSRPFLDYVQYRGLHELFYYG